MVNPQRVILAELAAGATQKSVALIYAFLIQQEQMTADWRRINAAIIERWPKGLARVKEMAWKIEEGKWGGE
jgi:hypothetical protein